MKKEKLVLSYTDLKHIVFALEGQSLEYRKWANDHAEGTDVYLDLIKKSEECKNLEKNMRHLFRFEGETKKTSDLVINVSAEWKS